MLKAHAVLAVLLAAAVVATPTAQSHPHPEASLETSLMPYPFWTEPQVNDIYHVPTGLKLSFEGMMGMISGSRVIYLGEIHNNLHDHRVQHEIIRELAARFPGRIAIGMEMFRTPQQASLDRWTADELGEVAFLKESGWYDNWGLNFTYYRDILSLAQDMGIDVVALNPSMELQRQVGMSDRDSLPPEVAASLPDTDSSDPYQRAVIRSVYGGHEGGVAMYDAFLRVQLLWEETMASRIADYLGSDRGEDKIMVVITGGAHVKYGFGVPKKVVRRIPLPYTVVLTAPISSPGTHGETRGDTDSPAQGNPEMPVAMDVSMPEVPLLAADFIWAVPYETLPDERVRVGITLDFSNGECSIDDVLEDSAAARAGILPGDVLLRLDDTAVTEMVDVVIFLRSKRFGDIVSLGIRRNGEEMTLEATLLRPTG